MEQLSSLRRPPVRPPTVPETRFEVLPLERTAEQAAALPQPAQLTLTCSPRHGPDHSVQIARRLRALGHHVAFHLAARMVRDAAHLDDLLDRLGEIGVDDVFLVSGDASPPHGEFAGAHELLPLLAGHRRRPARIGITGYPEGHPLVEDRSLREALVRKSELADYITTQLCFDAAAVLDWVATTRELGVTLPVFVGIAGVVDRRRLLEISMRIGVGSSLSFLRKQRGLGRLFGLRGRSKVPGEPVHDEVATHLGDPHLNLAGFHYYTFNQLVDTWKWARAKHDHVKLEEREVAS